MSEHESASCGRWWVMKESADRQPVRYRLVKRLARRRRAAHRAAPERAMISAANRSIRISLSSAQVDVEGAPIRDREVEEAVTVDIRRHQV